MNNPEFESKIERDEGGKFSPKSSAEVVGGHDALSTSSPEFADWQYEVANGDTQLGFDEWVAHQNDECDEEFHESDVLNPGAQADWLYEVANGDTRLGPAEWLAHKLEAGDDEGGSGWVCAECGEECRSTVEMDAHTELHEFEHMNDGDEATSEYDATCLHPFVGNGDYCQHVDREAQGDDEPCGWERELHPERGDR